MFTYFFNIGLTYFLIGFACALILYFIFRKHVIGKFWGALIVGLVGSYIGGLIDYFFKDVFAWLSNINSVNIFPPIITSFILLWIFSKISQKRGED